MAMFTRSTTALKLASRSLSTSARASDLAKVTIIGRLGTDPQLRQTSAGKPYYQYPLAVNVSAPEKDETGKIVNAGPTTWHTIWAFNERSHESIARVGKGSTVYVEADLEMKAVEPGPNGERLHDRAFLRHQSMRVINRVKPEGEEGAAAEE